MKNAAEIFVLLLRGVQLVLNSQFLTPLYLCEVDAT